MLGNLPLKNVTESAIAAAQLLPHQPSAVEILSHPDAVAALVAAFLEEHSATDIDTIAGKPLYPTCMHLPHILAQNMDSAGVSACSSVCKTLRLEDLIKANVRH